MRTSAVIRLPQRRPPTTSGHVERSPSGHYWHLTVSCCPYCGEQHQHLLPEGPGGWEYHRAAPCTAAGYRVIPRAKAAVRRIWRAA